MSISRFRNVLIYSLLTLSSPAHTVGEQCALSTATPILLRLTNCSFPANGAYYRNGVEVIDSWGLEVGIASPSQPLCLCPSTVINNTAIMAGIICNNDPSMGTLAQCVSDRGGVFNPNDTTSDFIMSSTDDLVPDNEWDTFNAPFGGAANTTIQFASNLSLPAFPVALVLDAPNSSVSQLGLANNSVFLHQVVKAGLSPVAGFGLLAGSQSVSNPRDGHLILGGYDAASLAGPFHTYPMSNTTHAGSRVCSLQVEVETLILRRPNKLDFDLVTRGTPMYSCIEPLDNLFRFPSITFGTFQEATNWSNDTSVPDDLHVVEPGLYYNSSFNGSLIFTLSDGLEIEIPSEELAGPVRGIDQSGNRVLQNNITMVNIFENIVDDTASLGKVYLTANYDLQQIQLALAVTDSAMAPDLISFDPPSSTICSSPTVGHWFIGVIVLACILAIVLVILSIYLFGRQKGEKVRIKAVIKEDLQETGKSANHLGIEPRETSLPQHLVVADGKARHESSASELNGHGIPATLARIWSRRSSKFGRGMSVSTAVSQHTDTVDPISCSPKSHSPAELAGLNQTVGDSAHKKPVV